MRLALSRLSLLASLALLACKSPPELVPAASANTPAPSAQTSAPSAAEACRARIHAVTSRPPLPGAPAYDSQRPEFLGRARGEPVIFVREPSPISKEALPKSLAVSADLFAREKPGGRRMASLRARHRYDPASLRALVLRDGYAYAENPHDALAIVTTFKLPDLFKEPQIWLMRGSKIRALTRKEGREVHYVDESGNAADLLFGDRVAASEADLARPLHRDLATLADDVGFDRTRIKHLTEEAIVADLRFGEVWAEALLESNGAALKLACMAAEDPAQKQIEAFLAKTAIQRRALAAIRTAVSAQVEEALPFDRPFAEPNHLRDGALRPLWITAYLRGQNSFSFEDKGYPVFDASGRPSPPEVCVDFVLDTYERASGTWFRPRGEPPGRAIGKLDFREIDIPNRRAVLAFGDFAEVTPELFEFRRWKGEERIQFAQRSRFFQYLTEHADEVRPGDVIAIQGYKQDDNIHQHAILVERADPVTGFPFGLADQMKRARRRTFEGIMAEAPKRSLFYRARPTEALLARIDPGSL